MWDKATSEESLLQAWERVAANKGAAGVDGVCIEDFGALAERNIAILHKDLTAGKYRPLPLRRVFIPKKSGGKRMLAIPVVRDRVVQAAVAKTLSDHLEPDFHPGSYGYRPGRSIYQAADRISASYRDGYSYVVDADIEDFFDSIPHQKLRRKLREHIDDKRLCDLIASWLPGFGKDGFGLAQGSPVSPVLSNFYLDTLDDALGAVDGGLRLVRFADDFVILAKSARKADAALEHTIQVLAKLGLQLNPDKTRIVTFAEGFRFLGHLFVRSIVLPTQEREAFFPDLAEEINRAQNQTIQTAAAVLQASDDPKADVLSAVLSDVQGEDPDWGDDPDIAIKLKLLRRKLAKQKVSRPAAKPDVPAHMGVMESASHGAQDTPDHHQADTSSGPELGNVSGNAPDNPMSPEQTARAESAGYVQRMRVLYLTAAGSCLDEDRGAFAVRKTEREDDLADFPAPANASLGRRAGRVIAKLPVRLVDRIEIHPGCDLTFDARELAMRSKVPISWIDGYGRPGGTLMPPGIGHGQRHYAQAELIFDAVRRLELARVLVAGRLGGQYNLLKRLGRRRPDIVSAINFERMHINLRKVRGARDIDQLMGFEGNGTRMYWPAFARHLLHGWSMPDRNRQPPTNPVNAVLSYVSSMLYRDIHALVLRHGLHPDFGVLHSTGNGNQACVSDLIEEFRAPVQEALTLHLFNSKQLKRSDFIVDRASSAVRLLPTARRTVITAYEGWLDRTVLSSASGHKTNWRGLIEDQIFLYCAVIEGRAKRYVPYKPDY